LRYYMDRMRRGEDTDIADQVVKLALKFRIMSRYTSFVAVEEMVRNEGGHLQTVQVPVEIPEGVSYEGIFGSDSDCDDFGAVASPPVSVRSKSGGARGGSMLKPASKEESVGNLSSIFSGASDEPEETSRNSTLKLRSLVILEGPVPEKEAREAFEDKMTKFRKTLFKLAVEDSAMAQAHVLTMDITLNVDSSGNVTLKSINCPGASRTFMKRASVVMKKLVKKLGFAGQSKGSVVKLSLELGWW